MCNLIHYVLFLIKFILFILMALGGTSLSSLLYYLHYGLLWFSTIFQPLELDCGAFSDTREPFCVIRGLCSSLLDISFQAPYGYVVVRVNGNLCCWPWWSSLLSTCSLHLALLCGLSLVMRSSELQFRDTPHWIESHCFNQLDFLEAFYKISRGTETFQLFRPFITFIAADILTFPFFFNKFSSTKKKNKKE